MGCVFYLAFVRFGVMWRHFRHRHCLLSVIRSFFMGSGTIMFQDGSSWWFCGYGFRYAGPVASFGSCFYAHMHLQRHARGIFSHVRTHSHLHLHSRYTFAHSLMRTLILTFTYTRTCTYTLSLILAFTVTLRLIYTHICIHI